MGGKEARPEDEIEGGQKEGHRQGKEQNMQQPKIASSESRSSSSSSSSESSSEVVDDLLESVEHVYECPQLDEDNLLPRRVFWRYFANEQEDICNCFFSIKLSTKQ
jgi:hypothetical protein